MVERRNRAAAGALALLASAGSAIAQVEIGMNYSWWRFDPQKLAECQTRPGMVWQGDWIIDQYHRPDVRETVQAQLHSMRVAGFTGLRTIFAYRRPIGNELTGALLSETGDVSSRDANNVRKFIADISAAGYARLEIVYGFLDRNAIFCKQQEFGDCFDSSRTEENWRFISQITEIAKEAAGLMPLRFDLAGEGCPAQNMRAETIANAGRYLSTIAGRFQAEFGPHWLVSCPDSPRSERAGFLIQQLAQAGISPEFIESHSYRADPSWIFGALDGANALARQLGATLILGEMPYHSPNQMQTIQKWLTARPESRLREIYEWPLRDPSSRCGMD